MTDPVFTLQKDINRSDEARRLLESDLLKDCFSGLETAYISAWRATTIDDVSGREKLFLAINIVGKVRDHLSAIVSNGNVAAAELKALRETAEREKQFG